MMLEETGDFAKTCWAARPRREAIVSFWIRTVDEDEGIFGDICCIFAPVTASPSPLVTFGERYLKELLWE